MSEIRHSAKPERPAGLVFFEAQEKPRQYVIFDRALGNGRVHDLLAAADLSFPG